MTEAQTTETSPKARIITNGDWCGCGDAACKFGDYEPISAEDAKLVPDDIFLVDGVWVVGIEVCTSR